MRLPARRKFGNKPTDVDGMRFDSAKEARRFGELRLLERAGEITELRTQPRFPLEVNGQLEDVKSEITRKHPVYRLKNKLFRAVMGFEITEV